MSLHNEIFEQPQVLQRLLDTQWETVQTITETIRQQDVQSIFLAARGTSDNAGRYAKYLFGSVNRIPLALAAPSLFSLYDSPPVLKNALVLGISQSGQSPDIVGVLEEARTQQNLTLAITNDTQSPLANAAEFVLDVNAGPEKAVAATKTYTAQLMNIAMLSAAWAEDTDMIQALRKVPDYIHEVLQLDAQVKACVERYRFMNQCVVLGRGYNYATAYEWSLKMKELAYIIAEPYSSADFLHGPIAVVAQGFPLMAIAADGAVFNDTLALLTKLRQSHQAELLIISNRQEALDLAQTPIQLPTNLPEWISPIVSIVVGQLFSYYLTKSKGLDVEAPRGLSKVTKTH
ncbi:MAG: SIS domain-containing protein [Chloroflexota bacterium]